MNTNIKTLLSNFISPLSCAVCGRPLKTGLFCDRCGMTVSKNTLDSKFYRSDCFAYFFYTNKVANFINAFKERRKLSYAADLAKLMAPHLKKTVKRLNPSFIVPVPDFGEIGASLEIPTTELLCQELSKQLGIRYSGKILRKIKRTEQQKNLNARDRAANLTGAFEVPKKYKNRVRRRTIFLVDDVSTTGATLAECKTALYTAGAAKVFCITVAKTMKF